MKLLIAATLVIFTYQTQYTITPPGQWFSQPPRTNTVPQMFYRVKVSEEYVAFGYTTNLLEDFHYEMYFAASNIVDARVVMEIVEEKP